MKDQHCPFRYDEDYECDYDEDYECDGCPIQNCWADDRRDDAEHLHRTRKLEREAIFGFDPFCPEGLK